MRNFTFVERTEDKGVRMQVNASDNFATYILTSAGAHDMYRDYVQKYERVPSSKWYNRHFNFDKSTK